MKTNCSKYSIIPFSLPNIVPTHNIDLLYTKSLISRPDFFIYKLLNLQVSIVI